MTDEQTQDDLLAHVPDEVVAQVTAEVSRDAVQAVAAFDLDEQGRYVEGQLVLANGRLGEFHCRDGAWQGRWLDLSRLSKAAIIEGLGMNLLRLLTDGGGKGPDGKEGPPGRMLAEFRFTLRHAKEVARLQRRLERRIEGRDEADEPAEPPRGEEKKVRCDKCDRVIPPWAEVCPACLSRRKVLSRLMDFVKPCRTHAAAGMALALIVTLSNLVRPWLTKPMLNRGLGADRVHQADFRTLMFYVLILAGLTLFAAVGHAFQQRLMASLGSRIARDVRDRAYRHLHRLSLSYFSRKPTGSLVTRITSDSDRIWDFVAFTTVEMSVAMLTIGGVSVALFVLNWKLACFVLIPVPVMIALMTVFHNRMHDFFHRIFHRWSQMTAVVSDAIPGVRVIKAFGQERREVDRFSERNRQVYEGELGLISLWTTAGPVLQFCSQVGSLLVWTIGGYWTVRDYLHPPADGGMTVGVLMAFIGYMWMFYGPVHMLAHMDRQLNRAATSVQRIFEILDTDPTIFSKKGAVQVGAVAGAIELRDVSFSYDGVRKVLKNVSLKIEPGEMIGLAGPSGGGKTTMVNLICRFYDVLEGRIHVDGVDVRDYELEALRRRIGVVLQEPFLFFGSVAANIAYGNPDATLEDIIAAAEAANAHDFIVGFPDGYDTLVGERGHTLSGGERQRISIARAILNNPAILILDEATSSVDTETEKLIQEALDRLIAHRTTIAIAHRLSTLHKADRLIILDKGEIVEQGTHDELAAKADGLYAKLLRTQTEMKSIIAIGG